MPRPGHTAHGPAERDEQGPHRVLRLPIRGQFLDSPQCRRADRQVSRRPPGHIEPDPAATLDADDLMSGGRHPRHRPGPPPPGIEFGDTEPQRNTHGCPDRSLRSGAQHPTTVIQGGTAHRRTPSRPLRKVDQQPPGHCRPHPDIPVDTADSHRYDATPTGQRKSPCADRIWSSDGEYVPTLGVAGTATGRPTKTDVYSRIASAGCSRCA